MDTEDRPIEQAQVEEMPLFPKEKEERKNTSPPYVAFIDQLEKEAGSEGKIRLSIQFMRDALTEGSVPRFRDFWDARKLCIPFFKEGVAPKVRSELWNEYVELSTEARRLKEILDEQSAFAVEQIELALQALERDLENKQVLFESIADVSIGCHALKGRESFYGTLQKELAVLNVLAVRVNSLRKEVIKTEMRIRIKNKLFDRLSACGDQVFPKRKELIKEISEEFSKDIESFIAEHFHKEERRALPHYLLREEIKDLQAIAKVLTLNTQAFTQTRVRLSECWDLLKQEDKERKKELTEMKQVYKQNYDLAMEKITPYAEACKGEMSIPDAQAGANEILDFIQGLELGREELRALKDLVFDARRQVTDRARIEEEARQKLERQAEMARRQRIHELKLSLEEILRTVEEQEADAIVAKRDALAMELESVGLNKAEKMVCERIFKQIKDAINEKREKTLMSLSADDQQALSDLKGMLNERKERRAEIKAQLEIYRKALGGSGFDFEKAMNYRELIETEKSSLEKMNASIEEIEEKIEEIEG